MATNNPELINLSIETPHTPIDLGSGSGGEPPKAGGNFPPRFYGKAIHSFGSKIEFKEVPLWQYSPENIFEQAQLESYQYPLQFRTAVRHLVECGKLNIIMECPSCHHKHPFPMLCHNRYCTQEVDLFFKQRRAYSRLMNIKINSSRLYHFTIGSNDLSKKQLEKAISKVVHKFRKKGYKLSYIKAFDIGNTNIRKTGKLYLHFHIALLPEKIDIPQFISMIRIYLKKINPFLNFSNIGWRSKENVFSYFAKRDAGIYGHNKTGYYYLKDIYPTQAYLEQYNRRKFLSYSFPFGLIYNNVPSPSPMLCPKCENPLTFAYYEPILSPYPPDPP